MPGARVFRLQPLKRRRIKLGPLPSHLKRCTKCRNIFTLDAFSVRGRAGPQALKLRAWCKNCCRNHARLVYARKTGLYLFKTQYAILRSRRPNTDRLAPVSNTDFFAP